MKTALKTETGKQFEITIVENDGIVMFLDRHGNEFGYMQAYDSPESYGSEPVEVSFDFKDNVHCITQRGVSAILEK